MPLKPALGCVCVGGGGRGRGRGRIEGGMGLCSLAKYRFACEEIQSNRVSDFRDFVCYLFPKATFLTFIFEWCQKGSRCVNIS